MNFRRLIPRRDTWGLHAIELALVLWLALGIVAFTSGCATTPKLDPRDPAVWQPAHPQYPQP